MTAHSHLLTLSLYFSFWTFILNIKNLLHKTAWKCRLKSTKWCQERYFQRTCFAESKNTSLMQTKYLYLTLLELKRAEISYLLEYERLCLFMNNKSKLFVQNWHAVRPAALFLINQNECLKSNGYSWCETQGWNYPLKQPSFIQLSNTSTLRNIFHLSEIQKLHNLENCNKQRWRR